ncbi:feruloyl esterase [Actinoplanes sp. SE50]|uniref:extracellular catalytic domain type 1 short-chain-length polyhydroxyalkanoate depolymerase n=1 Tax=Actinoplanes sp. SE50 TaxID=2033844 RepID=UPI00023EC986|nr:ricin-type beta-trefoil lectin domain protein [Actinoplanes sp. SE50]AEV84760.1 polyhydroxybutyrate depolymerase [Actinoplanes sp. SE50/110]ATO83152.1 feruloyl esterase [Actinoplanes sp. SE50]SLM00559.1 feruloyl esterase [Actinoplanes sp. SE50/110]
MKRRPVLVTLSVLLAGGAAVAVTLPASAAATGALTGLAGKCVDVAAGGTANGTKVQLWTCNNSAQQRVSVADDRTIRVLGKCLDVTGGVNADGTKVQLWDCFGNANQQWVYNSATKDIVNPATGRCLDAAGQSSADGTPLQIWTCNSQTNQDWVLPGGGGPVTPSPSASGAACNRTVQPGERTMPVSFAGKQYQVAVYVPAGAQPGTRLPLVMNLHGSGGTGSGQLQYSNMKPTADANQFLIVAPSGAIPNASGFAWNVPGVGTAPAGARDDIGFLEQVLTTATSTLCAAPTRVYGAGYSGGGRMTSAFACARPDRLAAIAPVGGLRAGRPNPQNTAQPDPASCNPARPVPVIAFHGQQDTTNPYPGGGSEYWQYSVPVAQARWAAINRCTTGPTTAPVTTHVTRTNYLGCANGADVVLYSISDGGHTWPGTPVSNGNGNTTQEINANTLMWQFFQRFQLPA